MKILTPLLLGLALVCAPLAASADKEGGKGPSERARERADDNASLRRGDYRYHDEQPRTLALPGPRAWHR